MPYTVIQAGTALQFVDTEGVVSTLTLPASITLATNAPPRWALFGNLVVLVNTPTRPLTIDGSGTVNVLTPTAPTTAPVLAAGGSGGLTGTYAGVRYTYVIKDAIGNTIAESDFSPPSNSVMISGKLLAVSNVLNSSETISAKRLYRPVSNGSVLFPWLDIDGNIITTVSDDLSDAGLSITAAPILGEPPRLTSIAEFRGRLFGMGDTDLDHLRYTEAGVGYSWPVDNLLAIPPVGADQYGVSALIPRRDALGVARRNTIAQVTGTGAEDSNGLVDFDVVILSKECGVESQETVVVFRDVAYFLWKDGVYSWGPDGINCLSDGTVRSWFVTDQYFNRAMFPYAFAHIDPFRPIYRLFLASAGSTTIDRFVEFDINDRTWWGPHKTDLFALLSAFQVVDRSNKTVPVIGGPTAVYDEQTTRTDGTSTPIAFDVIGKRHDGGLPDQDKVWGELSVYGKAQSGGTLAITSQCGDLTNVANIRTITQYWQMTNTRQRLGRPGRGRHCELEFTESTAAQDVELRGYVFDPVVIAGRR